MAFSKSAGEKAKAMKEMVANLWKKSAKLADADKAHAEKELGELEKKHDKLESQLKELEETGANRFESLKQDLTKALEEVEQRTADLTKKLEKRKNE